MRSIVVAVLLLGLVTQGASAEDQGEGACCLCDGECLSVPEALCAEAGGTYFAGASCNDFNCPILGACCLPDGSCVDDITETQCDVLFGMFTECASCATVDCAPFSPGASDRFTASSKGSVFFLPRVELRWRETTPNNYELIQDTFINVYNDFVQSVELRLLFVQGDPATANEPGCVSITDRITLTANQPTFWSSASGEPNGNLAEPSVIPFTELDPGTPPGRPDPNGSGDRVLRGYIVGWAVNFLDEEIHWNHLAATATIVNYEQGASWGYNGYHAASVNDDLGTGDSTGTASLLSFDGIEFARGYDTLQFNFPAVGSTLYSSSSTLVAGGELTLHPMSIDTTPGGDGPVTTRAHITVYNENEVKFADMQRCISCWDSTTMGDYAAVNRFDIALLQTDVGWAHVDAFASGECETPASAAALVGVVERQIAYDDNTRLDSAGFNLTGAGVQDAVIRWDIPERALTGANAHRRPPRQASQSINHSPRSVERGPAPSDRFSSSRRGNLFFLPKIEIRWDESGTLVQDTFVHLANTYSEDVRVRMFFVNGDDPLPEVKGGERAHPGWNWIEVTVPLTSHQPMAWSAASGDPARGIPAWEQLDPGPPPGRPDPEDLSDRMLRGFIVGWVVNDECQELSGGVLMADAVILNEALGTAWGYNAYHAKNIAALAPGEPSGTPGVLNLGDLTEFPAAFSTLGSMFLTWNDIAYSAPGIAAVAQGDLTLQVATTDFSEASSGPVTTLALFEVWNQNEIKFTNMRKCMTCWDEAELEGYTGVPNWFLSTALQTNVGKFRVTGELREECAGSSQTPLFGILSTRLIIDPFGEFAANAAFAHNLFGSGEQSSTVAADLCEPCDGDTNGDLMVNLADLLDVLSNWGGDGSAGGDANDDGAVNLADLLEVLSNWGNTCE